MANSKITITFNEELVSEDWVAFEYALLPAPDGPELLETWQDGPRDKNFVVQVSSSPSVPLGTITALNYVKSFNIDYNGSGIFDVSRVSNVVTIEALNPEYGFGGVTSFGDVTIIISNGATPTSITVTPTITPNINPCISYDVSFLTSVLADKWYLNDVLMESGNTDNPIEVDLLRGVSYRFIFEHLSGSRVYYPSLGQPTYVYIRKLLADNFSAEIEQSLNGATVTINEADLSYPISVLSLVLQYSLNDVDYVSSNVFSGQDVGNYTMYIKDQYGCKVSFDYTVSALSVNTPYLFISKANSINFIESVEWDNCNTFKTDENTLSIQSISDINYCENILFQTCDKITIQFHSNFLTQTLTLRDELLNETNINILKMSANLGRFESMDCVCYGYSSTQLGIYFDSGKTYDEVGADLSTYTLNGNLPDFAIIGQYINVENGVGYHRIADVIYDSNLRKKVILINFEYSDVPFNTSCKSLYNLLDFEVYQFEIDWNIYGEGLYDLILFNSDPNLGDVYHQSENILIKDTHDKTLAIRYYNTNNRDIFYLYGQENFIRVPYLDVSGIVIDDSDINIGDLITDLVNSSVNEGDEFEFDEMIKEQMRKLTIALSCEYVFINGVGYVKNGSFEVEPIKGTNLYKLTASMIKTNNNYNNNKQGQTGVNYDYETFDIPAFITDGTNLLKE